MSKDANDERHDERVMQNRLRDLLEAVAVMDAEDRDDAGLLDFEDLEGAITRTFEQAGVLTLNAGLLLGLADGSEYQLTVVRSR